MSRVPERSPECETLNDDLIEFALGTLSGRSRSNVLDHLETCPHCNAELDSLAAAADTLLWLAPEAEPSLGFETRLIERYQSTDPRQRVTRLRRASLLAAAAMLAVVLGVGLGAVFTSGGGSNNPASATRPVTGQLMSNGQILGEVTISSGSPSWMIMNIDTGGVSGLVWCEVTLDNGRNVTVGKFTLSHGYGSWVAPLGSSVNGVRSARIVNARGTVLAQATFAT
jgi:hypothetical protein